MMQFPQTVPVWHALDSHREKAFIRKENNHFHVDEILGFELDGAGEHLYLQIRKNGQNTAWVKEQIASSLNISPRDIGHSGLKDRHAITSQWLSIYAPKVQLDLSAVEVEGVELLHSERHSKKLRPGSHKFNRFGIVLTDFQADQPLVDQWLQQIALNGFPNYFGSQRFGRDGNNLSQGWRLIEKRRLHRHKKKSIYLSALRSFLFNQVLAARVDALKKGQDATFEQFEQKGPLWGRGRLKLSDEQVQFEQNVLAPWQALCEALEFSGLNQERRELFVIPSHVSWQWSESESENTLHVEFCLPPGSYATVLLNEIAEIIDFKSDFLAT